MAKSRDLADSAVIINFLDNTTSNVQNQIDSKQTYDANLTSFVTAFTLPTSDGSNGQVLSTDGLGNISFADVAASYGDIDVGTYLTNNGYDTSVNIISAITDAAPVTLDTLNELAAALGDDANFAGTVTTSLAAKANTADLAAVATTGAYADVTGTPILAAVATTGSYASLTGTPTLATVATTGAYSDLTGTPTVPTALTDLNITDGTAGQVLSADGDGTYTFIDAASGGGGSFEAVASGSLSDGSTVVLNADGTVAAVAEITTVSGTRSTPTIFTNGQAKIVRSTFDSSSNKVVVCYSDLANSGYVTVVVGSVNSGAITFGTPVVAASVNTFFFGIGFDSNANKVVLAYRNGSTDLNVLIGTVSGTSISFGSAIAADTGGSMVYPAIAFDSNSNKIVIAYTDGSNSNQGTAVVGTVSGNSATFGTPAVFETGATEWSAITFDSNSNKIVIVYRDAGNGDKGTAVVGDVSGESITFGTPVEFSTGSTYMSDVTFDSNSNKVVVVYREGASGLRGDTRIGTVSGTAITFGTPVTHNTGTSSFNTVAFDSSTNKILVSYFDTSGKSIVGTVSGDSVTFDTEFEIESGTIFEGMSASFDSNSNKVVVFYADDVDGDKGKAVVVQAGDTTTSNLTAENYAGIADAAYADAATATIQTAGSVDDAQSGLTPGQAYYVQPNGTLGLNPGTPSVFAGTAVGSTKLLIGKEAPASTVAYADVTGTPDLSSYATQTYVTTAVNNLVDTAPIALDTLNELAAALGDDANFAGTVTTSLAAKANTADLAAVATSGSYNDLTDTPTSSGGVSTGKAIAMAMIFGG